VDLLVFIFILCYFEKEISKGKRNLYQKGKWACQTSQEGCRSEVDTDWWAQGSMVGSSDPLWCLWPLRWLPSTFLPLKTYSCTNALRLLVLWAIPLMPKCSRWSIAFGMLNCVIVYDSLAGSIIVTRWTWGRPTLSHLVQGVCWLTKIERTSSAGALLVATHQQNQKIH